MTKDVVSIGVDKSVFEAAELMSSNQLGCLVILDGEVPVGIVTERDIVRRVCAKKLPGEAKVSEIMSKSLITIDPEASLKEAARMMSNNKIRRFPVLQHGKLVGILLLRILCGILEKNRFPKKFLRQWVAILPQHLQCDVSI